MARQLALGLDSSTQGLTVVAVDVEKTEVVYRKSIEYRADARLNTFGISDDYILPPSEEGEANQPALMYFASVDAAFGDMATEFPALGLSLNNIAVINVAAQQHGHVLLDRESERQFAALRGRDFSRRDNLVELLKNSLSLPFARIWRTSCTAEEADRTRRAVGGKENIIKLSGSNAPLRFSAFGLRKTARDFPEEYRSTRIIHQISSLIPALLAGNIDVALDYGNACGTSLMDYTKKEWSSSLLDAVSEDLPGGRTGLFDKLPRLASGTSLVGQIAAYFVEKYGFNSRCKIAIGSGDNPQAKVLVAGSLLSLGTSFVIMIETDGRTFDMEGHGNAMYDAFDRPFMFGCRTNGALRWDNVRAEYGMGKQDYEQAEAALKNTPAGNNGRLFLWQAEKESFPLSDAFGPVRVGYKGKDFAADYVGIVESTLVSLYLHSRNFTGAGRTLYVTGGPAESPEILRRVAAIWNTEVMPVEKGGAALGAAVSGAYALLLSVKKQPDPGDFGPSFLGRREPVRPLPGDIALYHGPGGYLEKYEREEAKLPAKQGQQ